ncbi:MAG TPA: hypothetical protein VGG57_03865 [Stellaceae bacterium]|jgi:hypothetical protein
MANAANTTPGALASGPPLVKITRQVPEICGLFPLSEEARGLLVEGQSPGEFLDRACAAQCHIDAIRFLAHALPVREVAWWACLVARGVSADGPPAHLKALEAAEAWVYHPDEDHRRVAMSAAAEVENEAPAHWAALAAAWSGGSLAPPEAPVVPPGETMPAQAAAGAVLLAAVRTEPDRAAEHHRHAIAQAIDIARGGTGRSPEPLAG